MVKKYNAAIIGCGRIGCGVAGDPVFDYNFVNTHATAFKASGRIDIIAMCDIDTEKLEKECRGFDVPYGFVDYKDLLKNLVPDILSICTYNSTHLEIVKEAVRRGVKFIFCEKPIADTLSAAKEMVDLCEKQNVVLVVNHSRRFDNWHQQLGARIRSGYYGNIQQVICCYDRGIANTGSHLFDLLIDFFGMPNWVQGTINNMVQSYNPLDPNIDACVEFWNGTRAHLIPCKYVWQLDIVGAKYTQRVTPRIGEKPYMVSATDHIINCLDGVEQPISTGHEAKKALEIVVAALCSAKNAGHKVFLPLKEQIVYAR